MSLLYGAGGTLENDMDDLTKDVWRKPMEKLKEAYDAGVIAPMDVDGEQAFGSGKAVFAQLGTWAQGNMSNTLGADKIAEANTLQYSADNPVNFFYQCNWMQLKDPHAPRRNPQPPPTSSSTCTSTGWIGLRSVPSRRHTAI